MNYNHVSETSESYDPDSKVVRSSQTVEQSSSDSQSDGAANAVSVANALPNAQTPPSTPGGGDKSSSTRTEETTNYEISKVVKTSTLEGGDIKKLSVAVVVDGESTTDAAGKVAYKPRSAKEMAQIEALVKSAIGFDAKRGDQVQVTNMEFARLDTGPVAPEEEPLLGFQAADWIKIIKVAILSLTALLIGFFVMRPLISRMFSPASEMAAHVGAFTPAQIAAGEASAHAAQAAAGAAALPPPKENMIDVSRIDGQVRESSIKKVGEVVQAHPDEALSILRTWLHEPA
jgi:flagellar M-ring protein FliF